MGRVPICVSMFWCVPPPSFRMSILVTCVGRMAACWSLRRNFVGRTPQLMQPHTQSFCAGPQVDGPEGFRWPGPLPSSDPFTHPKSSTSNIPTTISRVSHSNESPQLRTPPTSHSGVPPGQTRCIYLTSRFHTITPMHASRYQRTEAPDLHLHKAHLEAHRSSQVEHRLRIFEGAE